MILAILAMTLFCTLSSNAQVRPEQIEVNERLPDGTIILTINGVKYRALQTDHIQRMIEMRVNLESCIKTNTVLVEKTNTLSEIIQKAKNETQLADMLANGERRRADEFKKMLEDERALRTQAEQLPKKKNIIEKILRHPVTQIILVATAGTIAAKNQ